MFPSDFTTHIEGIRPHVHARHYDLIGPDSRIIAPSAWETTVEPGMKITMRMRHLPEPKEEPIPPPPRNVILNLDDPLGPEKKPKGKAPSKTTKKVARPSSLSSWMLPPGVVARYQHYVFGEPD
jgi:hypothetical protein